jgi:ribonuclease BN (tRNA processing enzyme)
MKIRIIGCHGGVSPGYQTTCYQVEDRFLIDCGSACSALTPNEQSQITDIFITHPHLDHIKDIAFLLENTFSPQRETLVLRSTKDILDDVHKHLLNDVIWPDFSRIHLDPKSKKVSVRFEPIKKSITLDGIKITPFPVNHPGHAVGYYIDNGNEQVVFTGDSGPCPEIWKRANAAPNLKAVFTEISFPNYLDGLARASGHFTLEQLSEDINALNRKDIPIYISHFKPAFLKDLMNEFYTQAPPQLKLLHEADEMVL